MRHVGTLWASVARSVATVLLSCALIFPVIGVVAPALDSPAVAALVKHGARLDIATGGARFELSGIVGKTYAAESTADFIVWEPFITNTLLTPQVEIHHPLSFSQRFYRARLLP